MISRVCQVCTKEFQTYAHTVRIGKAKFCSRKCYDDSRRGVILERLRGENHHLWAGDNVSYQALHTWVRSRLGKPSECQRCGDTEARQFEWANISHEYKRDLSDWIRLCQSCHRLYDNGKVMLTINTESSRRIAS
jgi:hypothetical protein